jgi:hypothetical protein
MADEMPIPIPVMLQVFDTCIIRIRLGSLRAQLQRGDFGKMVRLLEDCMIHIEGCMYTDVTPEYMEHIYERFLTMECLVLCGVYSSACEILEDVWELLNKNEWEQRPDKWSRIFAARLDNKAEDDIGTLAAIPNDVLGTIKALLVTVA